MTTVVPAPLIVAQFFNNAGQPAVGGSLLTQVGGVNYPTYSDAAGTVPLPNPIPLNSRGEVSTAIGASSQLFLASGVTYQMTLYDASGNIIWYEAAVNGGGQFYPLSPAEIAANVTPTNYSVLWNWVTRYGAKGDGITNDLPAFNTAAAVAVYSAEVYLPPTSPTYYLLSNVWTLLGQPKGTLIHGAGLSSIIVIGNGSGANAITVNGVQHIQLKDFGVNGTNGCGNGIEFINAAHYPDVINVWVGFVSGACFKNTQAISARYELCQADDNNAFRPVQLLGGLTDGTPNYGYWIPSDPNGFNNNPTFINCRANAVGGICSVQIGTSGGLPISTFHWFGGLIQGSSVFTEFYLVTLDSVINGAHIEPPVGAATGWIGTMDACTNTVVKNTVIEGDCQFINSCLNCGYESITGAGFIINVGSTRCFIRDTSYNNISTGLGGGAIKDMGTYTVLERLTNAGNANVSVGDSLRNKSVYFQTNMQEWVGGGAPTVPCGFSVLSSATVSQSTAVVYSGLYSCLSTMSTTLTSGFAISMGPLNELAGKQVNVEALVYNSTTTGGAYIQGVETGSGKTYQQASYQYQNWERMNVTFALSTNTATTGFQVQFTGLPGTVYWGPVKITAEDHTPYHQISLDSTSTPDISYLEGGYGGYPVRLLAVSTSTNTITSFTNPHLGFVYGLTFTGNRTVQHGVNIFLSTGTNLVATTGATVELFYGVDGYFRQI